MSSILTACGDTPEPYPPLVGLDTGPLREARSLVLLVLDGLGYEYLSTHGQHSVLWRHLRRRMTSVAPPTTATAITGFLTGQAPQQHGLTGWFTWFRELGTVLAVLPFTPRCSDQPLGKAGVSAARLFDHVPVFDRLARESWSVSPEWIVHSDFNRAHLGRATPVPYRNLEHCFGEIVRLVRQTDEPGYIYAYWPGFDRLAHEQGVASEAVSEHFADLDAGFARLLQSLSGTDTLVMVTADHGFVDVPPQQRIELADHPELKDCLILPLCGEQRLSYAYVRADRRRFFERYVQNHLSHLMDCRPSAALLERNLFGLGEPHPELASRIGDYVLVMKPGHVIQDPIPGEKPVHMTGFHGGLSSAEMYVPFIMAEC
jgi:hypothetical protein